MNPTILLIVTADDYGYHPSYDAGILAAAISEAIDSVSAFATRTGIDPEPLIDTGIEVGLHLDLEEPGDADRAHDSARARAEADMDTQFESFGELFGRPPAYLDGHHHCHAREGLREVVADFAVAHGLPVRSVSAGHRRLLRSRGVATPDLLVGRMSEDEPVIPAELADPAGLPGVVEWAVHPGRPAGGGFSSYDEGRKQDLDALLRWRPPPGLKRVSHAAAFA